MKDFRKYALLGAVAWSVFVIHRGITILDFTIDWTWNLGVLVGAIVLTVPLLVVTSWKYKTRPK